MELPTNIKASITLSSNAEMNGAVVLAQRGPDLLVLDALVRGVESGKVGVVLVRKTGPTAGDMKTKGEKLQIGDALEAFGVRVTLTNFAVDETGAGHADFDVTRLH